MILKKIAVQNTHGCADCYAYKNPICNKLSCFDLLKNQSYIYKHVKPQRSRQRAKLKLQKRMIELLEKLVDDIKPYIESVTPEHDSAIYRLQPDTCETCNNYSCGDYCEHLEIYRDKGFFCSDHTRKGD